MNDATGGKNPRRSLVRRSAAALNARRTPVRIGTLRPCSAVETEDDAPRVSRWTVEETPLPARVPMKAQLDRRPAVESFGHLVRGALKQDLVDTVVRNADPERLGAAPLRSRPRRNPHGDAEHGVARDGHHPDDAARRRRSDGSSGVASEVNVNDLKRFFCRIGCSRVRLRKKVDQIKDLGRLRGWRATGGQPDQHRERWQTWSEGTHDTTLSRPVLPRAASLHRHRRRCQCIMARLARPNAL